jgi:hypothetical protein
MTSVATVIYKTSKFQTPGPGAYTPPSDFGNATQWSIKHQYPDRDRSNRAGYDALPTTIGTAQKWSLSSRHKERNYNEVPGPKYVPPDFGKDGHITCFHQRTRAGDPVFADGPGVGKYRYDCDLDPGHKYSMKARLFPDNMGRIDGPGAGKYLPDFERVLPSPRRSMIRDKLNELSTLQTPGPGQYPIDRTLLNRPAAFHIQQREQPGPVSPGPKWDTRPRAGSETPSYSLRSRIDPRKELLKPPYQKLQDVVGNENPRWSFSIRPKDRNWICSPGPTYIPPNFGHDGRKWTAVQDRGRDIGQGNIPIGPGGGKYNNRMESTLPKWTMKAREFGPDLTLPDGPGTGKYLPDFAKVLPSDGKGRQILERFKPKAPPLGGEYVDLGSTNRSPRWTIQPREPIAVMEGCIE